MAIAGIKPGLLTINNKKFIIKKRLASRLKTSLLFIWVIHCSVEPLTPYGRYLYCSVILEVDPPSTAVVTVYFIEVRFPDLFLFYEIKATNGISA